jgi:hypothetical protein
MLLPYIAWECLKMERVMGIEPTLAAWEAAVLPLNYTRGALILLGATTHRQLAGIPPHVPHGTRRAAIRWPPFRRRVH